MLWYGMYLPRTELLDGDMLVMIGVKESKNEKMALVSSEIPFTPIIRVTSESLLLLRLLLAFCWGQRSRNTKSISCYMDTNLSGRINQIQDDLDFCYVDVGSSGSDIQPFINYVILDFVTNRYQLNISCVSFIYN